MAAIDKFDPFDFHRLYGDEKYNLQRMLLSEHGMPSATNDRDDKISSWWSDRIYGLWCDILGGKKSFKVKSTRSGDAFLAGIDKETALKIAKALCDEFNPAITAPTGVAFVRYTNAMSGYPTTLIIVVQQKDPANKSVGIARKPNRSRYIDSSGYIHKGWL